MNTTDSIAGFTYVLGSILFTVYGQIIVKWQVAKAGALPINFSERIPFFLRLIFNPWIMSGILAGFFALVCWLAAMTKFELSYAYPFMSLAFVLVLILSAVLFHEPLTAAKILGVILIIAGIIVGSRG
ncbi:MAG TPA: EamA family transporter [Pyrinomonadaceae bacterium]|nr:EamA family transporter [Pyrinomonadaceae bacterium]